MQDLTFDSPFGKVTFRALDHQSTMGAYVGRTAVKDGKGVMVDWRYADGSELSSVRRNGEAVATEGVTSAAHVRAPSESRTRSAPPARTTCDARGMARAAPARLRCSGSAIAPGCAQSRTAGYRPSSSTSIASRVVFAMIDAAEITA